MKTPRCHSNWTFCPTQLSANCAMQSALLIANISGLELTVLLFVFTNHKLSKNKILSLFPSTIINSIILYHFFTKSQEFFTFLYILNQRIIDIIFISINKITKRQIVNFDITILQNLICKVLIAVLVVCCYY